MVENSPERVKNTVENGKIAHYKQFLLFPHCFLKDLFCKDSSKLKEFADDNFKCHENERKLSKQVENTVGKGEIARNNCSLRAISPFPTVFSIGLFPRGVKRCHCVGMG